MVEDKRADAGFGIHHETFGELDADFFGLQQFPDAGLVLQIGAGGVAEAVALAAIARSEALRQRHFRRIGETPVFADAAVQPFGAAFGRFDGESLQAVAEKIIAFVLGLLRALADAFASGDDEKSEVVALAILNGQNIVAEAEEVTLPLPRKVERVQRLFRAGCEEMQEVAFGFGFKELPDRANLHERS